MFSGSRRSFCYTQSNLKKSEVKLGKRFPDFADCCHFGDQALGPSIEVDGPANVFHSCVDSFGLVDEMCCKDRELRSK